MSGSQQSGPGDHRQNGGPNSQGPGYHYEYNYNFNAGPTPPPRKSGLGDWMGIIVLLLIPTGITQVIAVIWALRKVASMSRQQRRYYYNQYRRTAEHIRREVENMFRGSRSSGFSDQRYDSRADGAGYAPGGRQAWAQPGPTEEPWEQAGQTQGSSKKAGPSKAKDKRDGQIPDGLSEGAGNGLIIGGAIMAGIFALGTVAVLIEFLDGLFREGASFPFAEELTGLLACAAFFAGGLAMLLAGISGKARRERYLNYLGYIGSNQEVSLAHMAATFGVSVRKLCKDLRRMLSQGILPTGYLDLAEGKLYLTENGYRSRGQEAEAQQDEAAARAQAQSQEDAILQEIRQINEDIPDEAMSAKISRIEEITAKILAYQKSHPNREGQLRPFLNYYLPTTLKILRAYAQLEAQGVEGENITAATARIEGMMDQVVAGFEKQLDKLFQNDAMDITSDVEVLENMLKKDGLSGDDLTMPMA